jgi:NAD+ diphosphatase
MPFAPDFKLPRGSGSPGLWFLFRNEQLLTRENGPDRQVAGDSDLRELSLKPREVHCLGTLDGKYCFAAEVEETRDLPRAFEFFPLRSLIGKIDENIFWLAGRARHLLHWSRVHAFCGKCGHRMRNKANERAKCCPHCGLVNHPRLSPAVIVAVHRGDEILLAKSPRFPSNFYSVLAGFVEPGENLETCVQREIQEEVNLQVKNICYFGSQPWPFPDSLMIGFTAQYAGGSIRVDGREILHAEWFKPGRLPPIPPQISIARQLINDFVAKFA